jgi:hypothetical protein
MNHHGVKPSRKRDIASPDRIEERDLWIRVFASRVGLRQYRASC